MFRFWTLLISCALVSGCATSIRDRAWLDRELSERTGAATHGRAEGSPAPDVRLEDGLSDAEVVSLALRNNPTLRGELTRIDSAFATLDESRRPANPQFTLQGPIGPLTAVATLIAPLESLWQLPSRSAAAAREADVAGEAVLMRALDIVRDARLLHIELGLAVDRRIVRHELRAVAQEFARIASVRAAAGDISNMDERVLYADALTSTDTEDAAASDVLFARTRLLTQLAIDPDVAGDVQATFATDIDAPPAVNGLIAIARAARPDVRSAEFSVLAAAARAGWERSRIVSVSALIEGQWSPATGPGLRLGARVDLPIFGANPGGIGRANAELERTAAQHEVVVRNVVQEVLVAHARWAQATRSRARFEGEIIGALQAALAVAQHGFDSGDTSYVSVLDVLRRVGEARLRRAELIAEQRRAHCELERAVGARLQNLSPPSLRGSRAQAAL